MKVRTILLSMVLVAGVSLNVSAQSGDFVG